MDVVFERAKDLKEKVETIMLKKVEWGILFSVDGERSVAEIASKVNRDEDFVKIVLKKLAGQDLVVGDVAALQVPEEAARKPEAKKEESKKKEAEATKAKKAKEPKVESEARPAKSKKEPKEPKEAKAEFDVAEITEEPKVSAKPEPKPEVKAPAAKLPAKGGGRSILVIDDSIVIQKMVEIALENETHQLATAMKGEEAIKVARETQPDLILLDIMLPDMSGVDVMKGIREAGGPLESVPIIILSGKDSSQDKDVALSSGANDFLTKPFHDEDLLAKVHEYLGK